MTRRMRTLLLFFTAFTIVKGNYLHVCRLPTALTELQYDTVTDTYVPVVDDWNAVENSKNHTNRRLHTRMHDTIDTEEETDATIPRSLGSHERIRVEARYCDCLTEFGVEPFYCPAHVQFCGATPGSTEGCYNTPPHQEVASNALFVASACLCAVLAWLVLSEPGKHVRNGFVGLVVPKWNDRLASNLLRQHPERALHMMRLYLRHLHQTMGTRQDQEWLLDADAVRRLMLDLDSPWSIHKPDDGRRPVALRLKTCMYQKSVENESLKTGDNDDENDDENADDCAICYQDLVNGEKIGVLVCGHQLHAACLKEWCIRRNTCPLCNCNEIAEPQYQNDPRAIADDLRRNLRI